MKTISDELDAQSVLDRLLNQLEVQIHLRSELLNELESMPLDPPRKPYVVGDPLSMSAPTMREQHAGKIARCAPRVAALAKALVAYCEAAEWEHFV